MHTSLEFLADQILVNQINVFLQLRKASVNEDFFFFGKKITLLARECSLT